jgi:peptide/nickel transport system substrate-binding protein
MIRSQSLSIFSSLRLALGFSLFALCASAVAPVSASGKTIRAVMHSPLRATDPILTTAYITRNHGYMIYDTLLGTDETFAVRPQMADWTLSADKLTYTFTLRDGLKWHDGKPVIAADCVASIRRWAAKDGMGQLIMDNADKLEASTDKIITLKLKTPLGFVPDAFGKLSYPPFMMPKRIAETSPNQAITEHIGSGPFKFVVKEFQPGVKAVYEKNQDYVPRSEKVSWTAGGKRPRVDRVEWVVMPDSQAQIGALSSGEIDMIEDTPFDLIPVLERNRNIQVRGTDPLGSQIVGRMNFLHPPFDKVEVRRAAMLAFNQKDFLDALVGNPKYYQICGAMFVCGTLLATDVGAKSLFSKNMDAARKALKASGYDGTPVVILHPTDVGVLKTHPVVAAQLLRQAGFKVDLQALDWQTVVSRRASQKPPSEGGWNMFFTLWAGADVVDPLINQNLIGRGKNGAWFGWPDDPKLEQYRAAYARAMTLDERKKIATELQAYAYDQVIYIPLGQFSRQTAWRKDLTGIVDSPIPLFWNMDKK